MLRVIGLALKLEKKNLLYLKYAEIQKALDDWTVLDEGDNKLNANEKGRFIEWHKVLTTRKKLEEDFNKINKNPNTFDYILLPDYDSVLNSTIQFPLYDSIEYYPDMKTWLLQKKF